MLGGHHSERSAVHFQTFQYHFKTSQGQQGLPELAPKRPIGKAQAELVYGFTTKHRFHGIPSALAAPSSWRSSLALQLVNHWLRLGISLLLDFSNNGDDSFI